MIEADLYAVIKNLAGGRVFPVVADPGQEFPQIVYQRISSARYNSLNSDQAVATIRVQVTCWAKDATTAKTVAGQVKVAVRGSGLTAHTDSEHDDYDQAQKAFAQRVDFLITGTD